MFSRSDYAPVVERFVVGGQQARLTQAALETLAVVAYRQPVSRARVSAVRGVNVDGVMRTLVTRGLVAETGSDPETGAVLYGTTSTFLERMGLRSVDERLRSRRTCPRSTPWTTWRETVWHEPGTATRRRGRPAGRRLRRR
ncbi:hypothetical protein GCM10025868_44880 [Angustibacter aerolatus]|uniref:Segregation and condensation protein B n=1 Tax=Angustibacter aerolatus TaxID=1162965 RepID=A0ABQ6JPD2_9ACTN|nr:hypothetical protein GCM10025868_44880 [Angustibacter aerolatus]